MAQLSKPGNTHDAKIVKVGHTANSKFGSNPDMKVKGDTTTRDLGIRAR